MSNAFTKNEARAFDRLMAGFGDSGLPVGEPFHVTFLAPKKATEETKEEKFARLRRIDDRHHAYTTGAFIMRKAIAEWAKRKLGLDRARQILSIEIPENKQFPEPEDE